MTGVLTSRQKTANMLFAVSIAEKVGSKGLVALSLHSGQIATNMGRQKGNVINFDMHGEPQLAPLSFDLMLMRKKHSLIMHFPKVADDWQLGNNINESW